MSNCYVIYLADLGFIICRANLEVHVINLETYVCGMYVYILIVCSKCDAVGLFLACIYTFR